MFGDISLIGGGRGADGGVQRGRAGGGVFGRVSDDAEREQGRRENRSEAFAIGVGTRQGQDQSGAFEAVYRVQREGEGQGMRIVVAVKSFMLWSYFEC